MWLYSTYYVIILLKVIWWWINKRIQVAITESHVAVMVHDDVIKWKHFPRYWPFVREIHRSPVNFPHKGQWRGALMFTLICVRINGWANNHEAGDLRRNRAHRDVTVMWCVLPTREYPGTEHPPLYPPHATRNKWYVYRIWSQRA